MSGTMKSPESTGIDIFLSQPALVVLLTKVSSNLFCKYLLPL